MLVTQDTQLTHTGLFTAPYSKGSVVFWFLTLCITLWGEATQCISRAEELKVIEWRKVAMYLQYWMQKYHVIWFLGSSARALSGTLLIFKTTYLSKI